MTARPERFTSRDARFYRVDGQMLPSVTTVLQALSKPALIAWSGKVNREGVCREAGALLGSLNGTVLAPDAFAKALWTRVEKRAFQTEQLRAAGDIGTQAHARIEWLLRQQMNLPVGPEPEISDAALWASLAWEDWAKSVNLVPIRIEQVVYHAGHGYAGTADLVALVDGKVTLLDWKTGKAVYDEAHLQNAAYSCAWNEDPTRYGVTGDVTHVTRGIVVRLPKVEGDPGFEVVEVGNPLGCLNAFLALLQVWRWQHAALAEAS